jgi:hypothetical protein
MIKATLSFNYIYQHVQDGNIVLHAKGHYEIECIDSGENFPRIQRCNLTLLQMIRRWVYCMLEMNKTLSADHQLSRANGETAIKLE